MGAPELTIASFSGGLGTVKAAIRNTGNRDAINTSYTIALNGGIILSGLFTQGTIDVIPAGGYTTITSDQIFGIGFPTIVIDVNGSPYSTDSIAQKTILFLSLILA